jgi:hypothetical protein
MSIKKMKIHIHADGKTEIRVIGGQGENCLAFTRVLEESLGRVEQRVLSEEYYEEKGLGVAACEQLNEKTSL